ncbi:sugar diacid utilization regulator [Bacillus thermophilus]|uniref:Sugar diacid utilization regulator n=1 Tax=Siminovitchia thermophila TaxID=1245522 RepID=A0ABS2R5G0_9BACI|nr:PucR family transcriptional regulator [Siminovitchia thermophila]MBM7714839.1 sugar diacid utilization regulator [Siminovitchia thermophila]ONK21726.1 hypothetical protein BLX87_19730 [Bacillus sp. VT-16-64]
MNITYKVVGAQDFQNEQQNMIKHGVSVKEIVHFTSIFQKVLVPPKRDRMIQKVSVIEVKEFGSWLKGNELALTTIQNFHTKELQLSLLQQLIKGKAACLVFHPGNIHEKQEIFHETLEFARRFHFPVFQVFPTVTYAEIIELIFNLKMKKQHQEIDTLNEVNQLYFQFLSHHINLKEMLHNVKRLTEVEMILTDVNMKPLTIVHLPASSRLRFVFESDQFQSFMNREEVFKLFINGNRLQIEITDGGSSMAVLAEPVMNHHYLRSVIFVLLSKNKVFTYKLLESTVEALSIEKDTLYEARSKIEDEANRELFEKNNVKKAQALFEKIGFQIQDKSLLIVMDVRVKQVGQKEEHAKYVENLKVRVRKSIEPYLLKNDFSTWYKNKLIIFISSETKHYQQELLRNVAAMMNKVFFFLHFYIGVSGAETESLYKAFKEALAAIKHCMKNKERFSSFDDIGFLQVFTNQDTDYYLVKYYEQTLRPLLALEPDRQNELLVTLERFVDHNLHYKETAESLFVHPNTVRYRIQKIKEIFADEHIFSDHDKRFNIYFALKLWNQHMKSRTLL